MRRPRHRRRRATPVTTASVPVALVTQRAPTRRSSAWLGGRRRLLDDFEAGEVAVEGDEARGPIPLRVESVSVEVCKPWSTSRVAPHDPRLQVVRTATTQLLQGDSAPALELWNLAQQTISPTSSCAMIAELGDAGGTSPAPSRLLAPPRPPRAAPRRHRRALRRAMKHLTTRMSQDGPDCILAISDVRGSTCPSRRSRPPCGRPRAQESKTLPGSETGFSSVEASPLRRGMLLGTRRSPGWLRFADRARRRGRLYDVRRRLVPSPWACAPARPAPDRPHRTTPPSGRALGPGEPVLRFPLSGGRLFFEEDPRRSARASAPGAGSCAPSFGRARLGMTPGYLGLGSNVGDRRAHLRRSTGCPAKGVTVCLASSPTTPTRSAWCSTSRRSSTPADASDRPGPEALLDACKAVEAELGATSSGGRHGPRPIDVDLLLLGDGALRVRAAALPHEQVTPAVRCSSRCSSSTSSSPRPTGAPVRLPRRSCRSTRACAAMGPASSRQGSRRQRRQSGGRAPAAPARVSTLAGGLGGRPAKKGRVADREQQARGGAICRSAAFASVRHQAVPDPPRRRGRGGGESTGRPGRPLSETADQLRPQRGRSPAAGGRRPRAARDRTPRGRTAARPAPARSAPQPIRRAIGWHLVSPLLRALDSARARGPTGTAGDCRGSFLEADA